MHCQIFDFSCQFLVGLILNGLLIGSIYALMALGLTIIFSILGIVRFAPGVMYMIGGYVVFFILSTYGNLNPLLAILAAGIVTFIIGTIMELLFLQRWPKARSSGRRSTPS